MEDMRSQEEIKSQMSLLGKMLKKENSEKTYVGIYNNSSGNVSFWVIDEEGLNELNELKTEAGLEEIELIEVPDSLEKATRFIDRVILRYPIFNSVADGMTSLGENHYLQKQLKKEDVQRAREAIQKYVDFKNKFVIK